MMMIDDLRVWGYKIQEDTRYKMIDDTLRSRKLERRAQCTKSLHIQYPISNAMSKATNRQRDGHHNWSSFLS
eukprot:scaffold4162_cov215-Chaetoceros_neogracile.AAC.1